MNERSKRLSYPSRLAAKLMKNKTLTHDEAADLITLTTKIHDMYMVLFAENEELRRELEISEKTVRLLQVD